MVLWVLAVKSGSAAVSDDGLSQSSLLSQLLLQLLHTQQGTRHVLSVEYSYKYQYEFIYTSMLVSEVSCDPMWSATASVQIEQIEVWVCVELCCTDCYIFLLIHLNWVSGLNSSNNSGYQSWKTMANYFYMRLILSIKFSFDTSRHIIHPDARKLLRYSCRKKWLIWDFIPQFWISLEF